MRAAITILYNSKHHLEHKGFWQFMIDNFDQWVIVEGLAHNGGTTSWCNTLDLPPRSSDGTHELCTEIARHHADVVTYFSPAAAWPSKDQMARMASHQVTIPEGFLWQVDADEHWTADKLAAIETQLAHSKNDVAACQFRHHVKQYVARGQWGSGYVKRCWKYTRGQMFKTHEPPKLTGESGPPLYVREKFEHYSYTFEQDVAFKSKYYKGYEGVLDKWNNLPDRPVLTINHLFPRTNPIGRSATKLIKQ